ncbi:hypothetical protein [Streptomyces acidiscabies]|uniref:Uncharacterized protein n=1 Tax=Streptomyces acidiscabies TaxID=42234 RepID=A0ABU4M7Q2_9ACTN|nr:hypothetical protein [Streptomyces acidiscabies]MDX3024050.1 hypothetical protein [Streptomyces acidiscabies]
MTTRRGGRTANAGSEEIAALLRAGVTVREVKARLHVGHTSIAEARRIHKIQYAPAPALRDRPEAEQRAMILARHPVIADLLREGATTAQVRARIGASNSTIGMVRRALGLATRRPGKAPVTITEALARHTQEQPDGHTHWTGPRCDGQPQLWSRGRYHSVRRVLFASHHGRAPDGWLRVTCDQPACIAGAHLSDRRIREQRAREDALYTAIFGPENPS